MQFDHDAMIDQLSLTEINQAQSFIRFKKHLISRLRLLLYLGIALILISGGGAAMTNRDLNSYWETSQTTAKTFAQEYPEEQFIYAYSSLIFGISFLLGLSAFGCGLYFYWKYNNCCLVENRLRKRERELRNQQYPTPKPDAARQITMHTPLTRPERERQYPSPAKRGETERAIS